MYKIVYKNEEDNLEVYRCTECGTVFFINKSVGQDISKISCPICNETGMCDCEWYDKTDQFDERVKHRINYYKRWQQELDRSVKYKEDTGLSIRELYRREFYFGKHKLLINVRVDDATKSKKIGRYLLIRHSIRYEDKDLYIVKHTIRISLSRSHLSRYFQKVTIDLKKEE